MNEGKLLSIMQNKSVMGYKHHQVMLRHLKKKLESEGMKVYTEESEGYKLMVSVRMEDDKNKYFVMLSYQEEEKQWTWGEVRSEPK